MSNLDPRSDLKEFIRLARSLGNRAVTAHATIESWPEGQVVAIRSANVMLRAIEPLFTGCVSDRKRKFSWQEAVELRAAKMSVRAIAKKLGVTRSSVQHALKRMGQPKAERSSPNKKNLDREMIVQAYIVGLTLGQLAGHYKTSPGSIRRCLSSKGLQCRKQGSLISSTEDRVSLARDMAIDRNDKAMLAMILDTMSARKKGTWPIQAA